MKKLLNQITGRRFTARGTVELHEATGQVCDQVCRSAAHLDRVRTAAYRARL
ncbi:hypothetical protein [Actinomadura sp. SCN-SB]|uniref:hypothetical protein n=1 Tax=Actinomadura sp. SCN-SB TaxID=3373092 RepID=UPI00374FFE99